MLESFLTDLKENKAKIFSAENVFYSDFETEQTDFSLLKISFMSAFLSVKLWAIHKVDNANFGRERRVSAFLQHQRGWARMSLGSVCRLTKGRFAGIA